MKRILSLILVLVLVAGSFSSFATPMTYGEKLYELGLVKGIDDQGTLAEGDSLTRAQMAVVLSRMYGVEEEAMNYAYASTFTDVLVDAWYGPYVAYAQNRGWTVGYGDGTFGPNDTLTAAQASTFLLRTLGYSSFSDFVWSDAVAFSASLGINASIMNQEAIKRGEVFELMYKTVYSLNKSGVLLASILGIATGEVEIVSVEIVDVNKIKVTFNQPVATENAVITLFKGVAISTTTTQWSVDKFSVILTSPLVKLTPANYKVKITGVTDQPLEENFTIIDEEVAGVEVMTDRVDIVSISGDEVAIYINVYNQYGTLYREAGTSNLTVTIYETLSANFGTVTKATSIDSDYSFKVTFPVLYTAGNEIVLGDAFNVTAIYGSITSIKSIEFSEPVKIADITFGDVRKLEGNTRIYEGDEDLVVEYSAIDQYGDIYMLFSVSEMTWHSSDPSVVDVSNIDVDSEGKLTIDAGVSGTTTITAVVEEFSTTAKFTVTVETEPYIDSVELYEPEGLITDGETASIKIVVYDQFGYLIESENISGLTYTATGGASVVVDGDYLKVVTTEGDFTVNANKGVEEMASVTFEVESEAFASSIESVDFSRVFNIDANALLSIADLSILDQYGRNFEAMVSDLVITHTDGDTLFDINKILFGPDSGKWSFESNGTSGTEEFTVEVGSAIYIMSIKVVSATDELSYEFGDIGVVYANPDDLSKFYVEIELIGKTSLGEEVVLVSNKIDQLTSSSASLVVIDTGTISGGDPETDSVSILRAFDSGGNLLTSATVQISIVEPMLTTIELSEEALIAAVSTYSDVFKSYDQYGVDFEEVGIWYVDSVKVGTVCNDGSSQTLTIGEHTIKFISCDGETIITEDILVLPTI